MNAGEAMLEYLAMGEAFQTDAPVDADLLEAMYAVDVICSLAPEEAQITAWNTFTNHMSSVVDRLSDSGALGTGEHTPHEPV